VQAELRKQGRDITVQKKAHIATSPDHQPESTLGWWSKQLYLPVTTSKPAVSSQHSGWDITKEITPQQKHDYDTGMVRVPTQKKRPKPLRDVRYCVKYA